MPRLDKDSIGTRLYAALALVLGLMLLLVFFFFSSYMINRILAKDMVQSAALLEINLERELESRVEQTKQIARDNALQVLLTLDLSAQAERFLAMRLYEGPFLGFRLQKADETLLAEAYTVDHTSDFSVNKDAENGNLFVLQGRPVLAVRAPIRKSEEIQGYLTSLVDYPGRAFLERIGVNSEIGLVVRCGGKVIAATPWLEDMDVLGSIRPDEDRISGDEGTYLVHRFPADFMHQADTPMEFLLVRNIQEALQPLRYLLYLFLTGWCLMFLIFLAFARYTSMKLVKPVLELAGMADHVARYKRLPQDFRRMQGTAAGDEISSLFRSFHEMVTSLNTARREAEAADRAKTNFLSMVSHELRTPLTSVMGFTKIIRRKLNTGVAKGINPENAKALKALNQVNENLDIMIAESTRLTDLINDVLDLAKLESGRMEWKMRDVRIEQVI